MDANMFLGNQGILPSKQNICCLEDKVLTFISTQWCCRRHRFKETSSSLFQKRKISADTVDLLSLKYWYNVTDTIYSLRTKYTWKAFKRIFDILATCSTRVMSQKLENSRPGFYILCWFIHFAIEVELWEKCKRQCMVSAVVRLT